MYPCRGFHLPVHTSGNQTTKFMHIIDNHVDRKIQSLFDCVRNNRDNSDPDTTYKNHIEDWEHFEDGSSGVFSVLVEDRSREEEDDEPYLFPSMYALSPEARHMDIAFDRCGQKISQEQCIALQTSRSL